jgi:hypothetical protein
MDQQARLDAVVRSAAKAMAPLDRLDEADLFQLLGSRITQCSTAPMRSLSFDAPVDKDDLVRGPELFELGQRIFWRWSGTLHRFICSPSGDDADVKSQLLEAIGSKGGGLTALTAGILVSSFGVSPAIAAVVAALLLKLVFQPAGDEICEFWGNKNAKRNL